MKLTSSMRVLVPPDQVEVARSLLESRFPTFAVEVVPATGFEISSVRLDPKDYNNHLGSGVSGRYILEEAQAILNGLKGDA